MRNIDFSPLYRSAIGFDRLFNLMENSAGNNNTGYPPYNIEQQDEHQYRITMAVAGFSESQIEITQQHNWLLVVGRQPEEKSEKKYLYQGIAERSFERKFQLADNVKVVGATMENGLLHIELQREIPEEQKPRRIEIGASSLLEAE